MCAVRVGKRARPPGDAAALYNDCSSARFFFSLCLSEVYARFPHFVIPEDTRASWRDTLSLPEIRRVFMLILEGIRAALGKWNNIESTGLVSSILYVRYNTQLYCYCRKKVIMDINIYAEAYGERTRW